MARSLSAKEECLLVEPYNYSAVHLPLKSTQRIKYTCFDVSQNFLVFGATSGGLYIFKRDPCSFLQLLPNKEGSVSHVAISPDEKLIAFASVRGIVCVLSRGDAGATSSRCLNRSLEHSGSQITALSWVAASDQLFVGDMQGRMSIINVSLFMSKNIFHVPAFVFMNLDSAVVQISCSNDRLLVSTLSRCYVCDTVKEQYRQVGTKLREGEYGACYLGDDEKIRIYCARPGSRLWEVDTEGIVQSTHQFKQALAQQPAMLIQQFREPPVIISDISSLSSSSLKEWPEQSFNFAKLFVLLNRYLFTFKRDGIYIFDPEKVCVVLWSDYYKDIVSAKCIGDTVFIWTSSGEIHGLTLTPLDKCLLKSYFQKHYELCSTLCKYFSSIIIESKDMLCTLAPLLGLKDAMHDKCDVELLNVLKRIELFSVEKEKATRLDSGIFLVDNHHLRWKLIDGSEDIAKTKSLRSQSLPPAYQNKKTCSQNTARKIKRNSVSSTSLPELVQISHQEEKQSTNSNYVNSEKMLSERFDGLTMHTDVHMLPIPFFPLSSPDIIHDALMEIGSNVSGKFVNSTRTLRDKWQILEGKLKLSKQDGYEQLGVRPEGYSDENFSQENHLDVTVHKDEFITKSQTKLKNSCYPNVDVTEITTLCIECDKKDSLRSESVENMLNKIMILYKEYSQSLVNNEKSKFNSDIFPFSQYLSRKCLLVIQNVFHESFRTGAILQWLHAQQSILNEEDTKDFHPEELKVVYSKECLKLDIILSRVLTIFSEILDPYEIFTYMELLEFQCTFLSCCVVMDSFQEGAIRYISKQTSSDNIECTTWPLPLVLNAIFLSFRLEQVDSNLRMALQVGVNLKMISYVLLKLSQHFETSGIKKSDSKRKCYNLLLLYISKLLDSNISINLSDKGLTSHIESAFIEVNCENCSNSCFCTFPVPGKVMSDVKYIEIGKMLISYYWDLYDKKNIQNGVKPDLISHTDVMNSECTKNGLHNKIDEIFRRIFQNDDKVVFGTIEIDYLKRIMKVCSASPVLLLWTLQNKAVHQHASVTLILTIQLGLVNEFTERYSQNSNVSWWENVFCLNADMKKGKCCLCESQWEKSREAGISWNYLANMVIKSLGAVNGLKILQKFSDDILPGELDVRFYQSCVVTSIVDKHTSGLRSKLLDKIEKVVASRQPKSPLSVEAGKPMVAALAADFCKVQGSHLCSSTNHHWGVEVDLENGDCALCSLNLGTPCLLRDGGLRVFKCTHTFHNVCLRIAHSLTVCPVCSR